MTRQIVELDSLALEWVETAMQHIQDLSDDFLLLEVAIDELQDFYQETYRNDAPKTLRRSLALLRHLASSQENSIDELSHLCDRLEKSLQKSLSD